jgi:hypothetical protein
MDSPITIDDTDKIHNIDDIKLLIKYYRFCGN